MRRRQSRATASIPAAVVPAPVATVQTRGQVAAPLALGTGAQTLATTNVLAFAIMADGSLWAWGTGAMGEFGDGERISRASDPVRIGEGYTSVATGSMHNTIAVKQVGTGFVSVSAGMDNYAIKADGTLWAWGQALGNRERALGNGTMVDRLIPTRIGVDFVTVSANRGVGGAVGVKRDGSLWAWGPNRFGTVGDGTRSDRLAPVHIGTGFIAASAGCYHVAALKSDGTLWTWGNGGYGQLGNDSSKDAIQDTPV